MVLLAIGGAAYLPLVSQPEDEPAAFSVPEVCLVAERREVLAELLEIVAALRLLVFDDLGFHVREQGTDERGHL